MGKNKKKENQLAERMKKLEKVKKKHGLLYVSDDGGKPEKAKKLKRPSWEYLYNVTLMHFQYHLYELICTINGIPLGIYVATGSRLDLIKNMKLDDEFKQYSKLEWDEPAPIDGLRFRGRFATCVLFAIIRKSHKMVKSVIEDNTDRGELTKKQQKKLQHAVLSAWIQCVDKFVSEYLREGGNYTEPLKKIEELLAIAGDSDPEVRYYIDETDELLHRREEAGVEVNNLTKVAYAVSTGSLNTKKCPEYNDGFSYMSDGDVAEQVGGLGFAILKRRRKDNGKLPILYKAFQLANPMIVSRFYRMNQEAPEITVGLKALEFSKLFYGNDIRHNRLVDRMM